MAKRIKIQVTPKVRRKLASKFNVTESCLYNWLGEMEEGVATGNVLKCRQLAVNLGGTEWYTE